MADRGRDAKHCSEAVPTARQDADGNSQLKDGPAAEATRPARVRRRAHHVTQHEIQGSASDRRASPAYREEHVSSSVV